MIRTSACRRIPDFSDYPDLVVIMLGMRVRTRFGLMTLLGLNKPIESAGHRRPEGLLHYENRIIYSLRPAHVGMRWYWRDIECLRAWTMTEPHRNWWRAFLTDSRGTGFWHETYHMKGGMEAVYVDMPQPVGFSAFMDMVPAQGTMMSRHHATAPKSSSKQD